MGEGALERDELGAELVDVARGGVVEPGVATRVEGVEAEPAELGGAGETAEAVEEGERIGVLHECGIAEWAEGERSAAAVKGSAASSGDHKQHRTRKDPSRKLALACAL